MNERKQPSTILEAMAETARMAKADGKLFYLYKGGPGNATWGISAQYWKDWLFKAYPGGRKILSMAGKELVEKERSAIDGSGS